MKTFGRFLGVFLLIAILAEICCVDAQLPVEALQAAQSVSGYSILLPENKSDENILAASELNFFLKEICGVTLPVVTEQGTENSREAWISIGTTELLQASDCEKGAFEPETSVVRTSGNSIFLYGDSDLGATYAVYDLLEHWFSLKIYTPECYTYQAVAVTREELNIVSTPAVSHRTVGMYLTWYTDQTALRRMRVSNAESYMNTLGHSLYMLMPPARYYAQHPQWFSNYAPGMGNENWQLCLSNAQMRQQLTENVLQTLRSDQSKGKTYRYFAIVQNDGDGFCTCNSCKALNLRYSGNASAYAGAFLEMVNQVAEVCAPEFPEVIFYMAAYTGRTDGPPAKNITAADNVGVMYAPIDANCTYSYFAGTPSVPNSNARCFENIQGWSKICQHLMMWSYCAQFADYMVPSNSFDSLKDNVEGYGRYDVEVVFEHGSGTVLPNFETLRNYLSAKALYDGTIDVNARVNDFLDAYFGAAADAMKEYFNRYLVNIRQFEQAADSNRSWFANQFLSASSYRSMAVTKENFSLQYLKQCEGFFATAEAALHRRYTTNSDLYQTYKRRLDLEYFAIEYLYLELYPDELTLQQGQEMLSHVVKTISTWGITVVSAEKLGTWREHFQVTQAELDYSSFTNWDNGRLCIFLPFSGTVAGQSFSGVKITSTAYQPHFGLTEGAVENAKRYAVAHGFDTIAIHAYARLTNNSLVLNGQEWIGSSWKEILIPTEQLSTAYDFWSQSEGTTEIYLWFEFRHTSEVPTLPSTPQPEPTEPEPTHPQLKPTNPLPDEPDSVIPQPTIPKPTEPMPTSPTNPEAPAVNGDVNGDGKVNNKDYYYLYLYLKEEGNALKDELADINLDGQVNEIDLKCLHAFLTGHTVWIGGRYG